MRDPSRRRRARCLHHRTHHVRTAHGSAAPHRAFTPDTLVRVASVSKLVTALGVMRLVEAGTLDLDRDVSDDLGWRLRNPAFPGTPITLRMLLSHTSGLLDAGDDYAVPLGRSLRDAIGPQNWSAHAPGTWFHYTNYNFPVVATVMERATGERFDRLMARLILTPLGLDACFNWATCSDGAVARAAVLTDAAGVPVKDDLQRRPPAVRRGQPRRPGHVRASTPMSPAPTVPCSPAGRPAHLDDRAGADRPPAARRRRGRRRPPADARDVSR